MLNRILSMYSTLPMRVLLGFFFSYLILQGYYQEGTLTIISNIAFGIILLAMLDFEKWVTHFKWLYTGDEMDIMYYGLSEEEQELRKAELGKTNPLFVYARGKYFYYDDNYGVDSYKEFGEE